MMDDDIERRPFRRGELAPLIRRASELQESARDAGEGASSLAEIEGIAAEVGIDPRHLRQAAVELRADPASPAIRLLGGPFQLHRRSVIGGSITDEQWELIVRRLRTLTGSTGTTDRVGGTREWRHVAKDMDMTLTETLVSVRPGADSSTIEVRQTYRGAAFTAYLMGLVLGGTAAGIYLDGAALSELANTLIVGGSGMGGVAMARAWVAGWSRRQRRRLDDFSRWLGDSLQRPDREVAAEPAAASPAPPSPLE